MKRNVIVKQKSILDRNKKMKSGIFSDFFDEFNLLERKKLFLQKTINTNLLTEWQAIEVLHDDLFMIAAVFKFGKMNRTLLVVYDRVNDTLEDFSSSSYLTDISVVAPTLKHKSMSIRETKGTKVKILNELDKNRLYLKGNAHDLKFDIVFNRIAKPVVISLPMSKQHSVYTEKDLLTPSGYIQYKGKDYVLSSRNITILDDHRGYYPLSSGYDWFTCLGDIKHNGEFKKFAINLTHFYKNLNKEVTENGFWLNETFYFLPDVTFERDKDVWVIKDQEGRVHLKYHVYQKVSVDKKSVLTIDYKLGFGYVSGYIKTLEGDMITLDKMFALGEKRLSKTPLKSPYQ